MRWTMSKIHALSEQLTNIIAAGEVVERPMGVVKELVENSIDANATHIEVMITQGGLESIVVSDDGQGIDPEDVALAFKRHSTSKISHQDDLLKLSTHGFRGEALPSIAAVSNCICTTNNGQFATKAHISYGKIIEVGPTYASQGTTMRIEGLFLKTPARLKHMKSIPYENALILDVIQKFALSYPHIAFSLIIDEKKVLETRGSTLDDVIYRIYGKDIAQHCIPFEAQHHDFKVKGVIGAPHLHRASRKDMLIFTNSRMIRSTSMSRAISDGMSAYIPKDRYPFAVIFIEMDQQLLDVNVHPSKWEVRISKEKELQMWLSQTISEVISKKPSTKPMNLTSVSHEYHEPMSMIADLEDAMIHQIIHKPITTPQVEDKEPQTPYVVVQPKQASVLAQLHKKYILASTSEGLLILDQHAAMERIRFEYYQKQYQDTQNMTQKLIPLVIDDPKALLLKDELIETLNLVNIHVEQLHEHALVIREIPTWFQHVNEEEMIQDIVDQLHDKVIQKQDILHRVLATLACHSSIRFNDLLSMAEMQKIVDDLFLCEQPYHCPHGRPTMMKVTLEALFKEFGR
jgi:DNA mismatch repair protein MutL